MPTRWTFRDYDQLRRVRFLHFGRSFSSCDRPSNHSCVLSDDYYHGNDTNVYVTNDDIEGYNSTKSCRTYNSGSGSWGSPVTWYRLQVHGLKNVSAIHLTFESESESDILPGYGNDWLDENASSCANESLRVQPFGTVPFDSQEEMYQRIYNQSDYVRFDTFQFSGKEVEQFLF